MRFIRIESESEKRLYVCFFRFFSSFRPEIGVHLYGDIAQKPVGICKVRNRSKYVCKPPFQVLPALKSSL